jgi:two-component system, OmpR family, phosphate regulon sensor histidine kinase PhoR
MAFRFGVRLKLFLVSVALIAVSVVAADAYLTRSTGQQVTETVRDDLFVRAALVAREAVTRAAAPGDLAAWDSLADSLGHAAAARVTLIARDGTVVGDSDVPLAELSHVENHAARSEVAAALAGENGYTIRLSSTVQRQMMYVAVPVAGAGAVAVARVATPLVVVDRAVAQSRRAILVASLLALTLAVLLSSVAAQRMSRVFRELTAAARRMTEGDLAVRTNVRGTDEVGELAFALDQLAGSLSATLAELKGERDLQGRILEGMQEGVLVVDKDGHVVLVNGALRSMLLLGPDARGRLLLEAIRHAELEDLLGRATAAGGTTQGELDLPGLKPRRLLVHATSLAGEAGGLLAVFVDVTDLRRLESLRRDFVANVSHELRTPVTALLSATETLRNGALQTPAAGRFLDIVDRNAHRLQDLIEDLLELSRLDAHQYKLKKVPVDVAGLFGIVLGLFRERADAKGVRLATRIAPNLPALESDPRAIEQVLVNLVDNAVKYCPSGATVTLVAEGEAEGGLRFAVEDTGAGIEAKHLPRIFERFYRVDKGRSRDVGGTGLGLSIVKHLSEAMDGELTVESTVGKGSTFALRFKGRAAHSDPPPASGETATVAP